MVGNGIARSVLNSLILLEGSHDITYGKVAFGIREQWMSFQKK